MNELGQTNLFHQDSYYFANAVRIATRRKDNKEVGGDLLKPAMYYVAVEEGDNKLFAAVSADDAEIYRQQMSQQAVSSGRKVVLLSASGRVIQQYGYPERLNPRRQMVLRAARTIWRHARRQSVSSCSQTAHRSSTRLEG